MAEVQKRSSPIGNAEMAQRFVQFVMMQAQNIYYVLGRIPSPDGRPVPPNLEAAKILIDQLEMVKEKTRGNLSEQELAILEEALKNVQLGFVEASGGTPSSMMPTPKMGGPYDLDEPLDDETPVAPAKTPAAKSEPAPAPAPVESESKKKFTKSYG